MNSYAEWARNKKTFYVQNKGGGGIFRPQTRSVCEIAVL
jgi:hypothetical protein